MWIEQQPPGLSRDHRRRCVETFKRSVFGPGSHAASLKVQVARLLAGDDDVITDPAGEPLDFGSGSLGDGASGFIPSGVGISKGAGSHASGFLTYEHLHQLIEGLLHDKGYYPIQPLGAGPQECLAQLLPAPNFLPALNS
ncbi:MAG: hypothetical protein WDW38_011144 [Sanguina aurantia]